MERESLFRKLLLHLTLSSTLSTSHLAGRLVGVRPNSWPVRTFSYSSGSLKVPWMMMAVFLRLPWNRSGGEVSNPWTHIDSLPLN